ncbi:hypothetical protein J0X14_19005 [Muricauda sp. CAU 1633]|jgi:hypothetical protein|uniref:hypothetical protein n=1 Tax=Allomuricauda sp. CAU 1633 TaxID=2816036 RepID=UPI001A907D4D|nr:hypothetical protein [Muricauda sp. CAU 1633]MBO0324400.1 hypothetical protein [Muricauda sp. CAU 1633]
MKISNDSTRRILIFLFALTSIISLVGFGYLYIMTAFAIGWGGGDITTLELIWKNKSALLFFIYSLLASTGLKKRKSIGIIFGYAVPISFAAFLVYFEISMLSFTDEQDMNLIDALKSIFGLIIWLILPILIIVGVHKIRKENQNFGRLNYFITGCMILILSFSLITMFDFL